MPGLFQYFFFLFLQNKIVRFYFVTSVFIVGPMAILPMTAMRALRAGQAGPVLSLAKSTAIFSYASLLVVVFGFGVMGMADPVRDTSAAAVGALHDMGLQTAMISGDVPANRNELSRNASRGKHVTHAAA